MSDSLFLWNVTKVVLIVANRKLEKKCYNNNITIQLFKESKFSMNKNPSQLEIDLVGILNRQKQVFWGIFDILSMVVSIIVSYILFYGLINPAPVDYIIYTSLAFHGITG